ncbi:MAG: hypothetical protein SH848_19780, partial [Saprospiraceae bacterium]|nr:hypothetical protein [Saprospiraceae bacterium]MDZ4706178.1 hypothetical protein [Saprospiraceae bacterium]
TESNCGKSGGKRKFGVAKSHRPNREVIISAFLRQNLQSNTGDSAKILTRHKIKLGQLAQTVPHRNKSIIAGEKINPK